MFANVHVNEQMICNFLKDPRNKLAESWLRKRYVKLYLSTWTYFLIQNLVQINGLFGMGYDWPRFIVEDPLYVKVKIYKKTEHIFK